MKIRNGFVSNSSSSSFIIDSKKYTCVDVALDMADTLRCEGAITDKEFKKIVKNLENIDNKNVSIIINCADDVTITKEKDKIYVEGSNHYDWSLDCIGYGEECEFSDLFEGSKWFFPEYGNKYIAPYASRESRSKYKNATSWGCDCGGSFLEHENIVFCVACMKDPDGKQVGFREEKLKRILK